MLVKLVLENGAFLMVTLEQAAEFAEIQQRRAAHSTATTRSGGGDPTPKQATLPAVAVSPPSQWERFMKALAPTHHAFLSFVKANGNPTLEEIVSGLGLPSKNSVGGTTRAIDLHATRCGYKPGEIFSRDVMGVRPNKVIRYVAGAALLAGKVPTP